MNWENQKLALLAIASVMLLIFAFVLGIAVGVSQTLKDFLETLIPVLSLVGTWVASIATIAAVWVALWLAESERRSDVESIKPWCGYVLVPGIHGELLAVKATANGKRPTRLTSIAILSPRAKQQFIALKFHPLGNSLPLSMSYGESAIFLLDKDFTNGLLSFIKIQCEGNTSGLKVIVASTIKQYEIELDPDLRSLLEKRANDLH